MATMNSGNGENAEKHVNDSFLSSSHAFQQEPMLSEVGSRLTPADRPTNTRQNSSGSMKDDEAGSIESSRPEISILDVKKEVYISQDNGVDACASTEESFQDSGLNNHHLPTLLYQRGLKELKDCQYKQAERTFRTAVAAITEGVRWPWIGVIQSLVRQNKTIEAIEQSLQAALTLQNSPTEPPVPLPWWLFQASGLNNEVADCLNKIISRYPEDQEALISLSMLEAKLSQYTAAENAMIQAAELHWSNIGDLSTQSRESNNRKAPSFLIIGQMKAGTTSLFDLLSRHKEIDPPLF